MGVTISYGALAQRVQQIAQGLQARGASPGRAVAIYFENSPTYIALYLAIMKTGCTCVPLNVLHPAGRIAAIVRDTQPVLLVSASEWQPHISALTVPIWQLPSEWPIFWDDDTQPPQPQRPTATGNVPMHVGAALYYVAGVDGRPAGAPITHASLNHVFDDWQTRNPHRPEERFALWSQPDMAIALWEWLLPLSCGASVAIVPEEFRLEGFRYLNFLQTHRITTAYFPVRFARGLPSIPISMVKGLPSRLLTGFEPLLTSALPKLLAHAQVQWHYCTGNPETGLYSLLQVGVPEQDPQQPVPLGKAIGANKAWVINEQGKVAEPGQPGELYIAGPGLSPRYHNRPQVNAKRFVPLPGKVPGGFAFRTGERVIQDADGILRRVGGGMMQTTLEGMPIQPQEVATVLKPHVGALRTAVALHRDPSTKQRSLMVCIEAPTASGHALNLPGLSRKLREFLPAALVPQHWAILPKIPLNARGTPDLLALQQLEPTQLTSVRAHAATHATAATNNTWPQALAPVEHALACALDLPWVGPEEYFVNLGGSPALGRMTLTSLKVPAEQHAHLLRLLMRKPLQVFAQRAVQVLPGLKSATVATPSATGQRAAPTGASPVSGSRPASAAAHPSTPTRPGPAASSPKPAVSASVPTTPKDVVPLTYGQTALWWQEQTRPGATSAHVISILEFRTEQAVTVEDFHEALQAVVAEEDVLRGHMALHPGEPMPMWVTTPAEEFTFPFLHLPSQTPAAEAAARLSVEAWKNFNITQGPLIRAGGGILSPGHLMVMISMHHSVGDGSSLWPLVHRTLIERIFKHKPLRRCQSFREWAADERARWQPGPTLDAALAHWKQRLADLPPRPEWPWAPPPPNKVQGPLTGILEWELNDTQWQGLRQVARQAKVTDFCCLATLAGLMLQRIHGLNDLVMAYPVNLRRNRRLIYSVGNIVNLALLRLRFDPTQTLVGLMTAVQQQLNEDLPFADIPLSLLVDAFKPERSVGRLPWMQMLLAPNDRSASLLEAPEFTMSPIPLRHVDNQDHLQMVWSSSPQGCSGAFNYLLSAVPHLIAQGLKQHFITLVETLPALAEQPLAAVLETHRLSPAEHARLAQWNDTRTPFPADSSLHAVFDSLVTQQPHAIAVVEGDRHTSYQALDEAATALAQRIRHRMHQMGLKAGDPVALLMHRSTETLVCLLAILKAGGAYLPLNLDDPGSRMRRLLDLAGAPLVISTLAHAAQADVPGVTWLHIDEAPDSPLPAPEALKLAGEEQPAALRPAYVLFTSGSTGEPKAVEVAHRQVLRLVYGLPQVTLNAQEILLHAAPLAFDASTFEIWGALLHGARLVLAPSGPMDQGRLAEVIEQEGVTTLWLTATLFDQFTQKHLGALAKVRQLLAGGDVLPPAAALRLLNRYPDLRLFNGYGPTETTTFATYYPVKISDVMYGAPLPIGFPLGNTRIHVLDEHLRPVPPGQIGEVCIAGDGVALGYRGQPELTAEKFIPEPGHPGGRMYRSGDLGHWREDGALMFVGRRDHQLKIRGHRVELGEVERVVQGLDGVRAAAVLVHDGQHGRQLVACIHPAREDRPPHALRLASEAAQSLPGYMLPSHWLVMAEWPVGTTGKLDRHALTRSAQALLAERATQARQQMLDKAGASLEAALTAMWGQTLEMPDVQADTHFFQLGGNSLNAARLCAAIERRWKVQIGLPDIYQYPTPATLAPVLGRQIASRDHPLPLVPFETLGQGQALPPMVLIPGIGGMPHYFMYLALHFSHDRTLFGLRCVQPLGRTAMQQLYSSLDAMADFFVNALVAHPQVQAHQEVVLMSYSAGSVLLFFIRRQLAKHGIGSRMVVVDGLPPKSFPRDKLEGWVRPIGVEDPDSETSKRSLAFRQALVELLAAPIDMAPEQEPLLVVLSGQNTKILRRDWPAWWSGPIDWFELPDANHRNLMSPPFDKPLAAAIQAWLAHEPMPVMPKSNRPAKPQAEKDDDALGVDLA